MALTLLPDTLKMASESSLAMIQENGLNALGVFCQRCRSVVLKRGEAQYVEKEVCYPPTAATLATVAMIAVNARTVLLLVQ